MSAEPQTPDTRWNRLRTHGAVQAAVIFASSAWLVLQAADLFGLPMFIVRLLRHLRVLAAFEPPFGVLLAPQLAAAYEAAGMKAEARRTWMRYISILEQGDPEVQPHVEAARRALDGLVGEPDSG